MEEEVKKTRITIAEMQEINRLYDSGLNMAEVGKIVGWSTATVGKYVWNPRNRGTCLKSDGRKPKVTEDHIKTINELHDLGHTQKAIAEVIGFSKQTVSRYIKKQEEEIE